MKRVNTFDNVFYDYFDEMKGNYAQYITDIWEESKTVCMANTGPDIGLFNKSDIIVVYSSDNSPSVITERIYKKNYGRKEWWHIKRLLKEKVKYIGQELGYNIRVTTSPEFLDYVHFKEEWWEWARNLQQSSHS